ncbi:MAG: TetR/AcrR family transcriptional regulator [Micropruina sp.]|uniref:TetR/AcrR family transcriptional regulator n=1 Tax=Micropruina sp. TaxID=2737536 RepID=UPI0039E50EB4
MTREVARTARGVARMAQILDAASAVFARVGYDRATTNAIAAEAGISPGSLYQFYADKAAIAAALGERLATELEQAQDAALADLDPTRVSLSELAERVLDPLVRFAVERPAFPELFAHAALPDAALAPVTAAKAALHERIADLLGRRMPHLDRAQAEEAARIAHLLVHGSMAEMAADPVVRREVTRAVVAYLATKERAAG